MAKTLRNMRCCRVLLGNDKREGIGGYWKDSPRHGKRLWGRNAVEVCLKVTLEEDGILEKSICYPWLTRKRKALARKW